MAATILHLPGFKADPARHGTRTEHGDRARHERGSIVLIGGTAYAGEIKKIGVLAVQLPRAAATACCPMHCSANIGRDGDTALFFGLRGTGKTTLSNDPDAPADRRRRAWLERQTASSTSKAAATPRR